MTSLPANVLTALGAPQTLALVSTPGSLGTAYVPNEMPTVAPVNPNFRLAIVGEAPGAQEELELRPFVGGSGQLLDGALTQAGIVRATCFVGNLCNYRPPSNEFEKIHPQDGKLLDSIERLRTDLATFKPNLCLLLGRHPLRYANPTAPSITDFRGSIFQSVDTNSPFYGYKCLATYHPSSILRVFKNLPLFKLDLARASRDACSSNLDLPVRRFITGLTYHQVLEKIQDVSQRARTNGQPLWLSFDLEGYWDRITRFSIATSPAEGFIVPITRGEYDNHWPVEQESVIWMAIRNLLGDPSIPKVLQNSNYDRFVLAYLYKIVLSNVRWDTMIGHWEMFPELRKNLGLQTSIYTREPYYKEDREADDLSTREVYCIKDSTCTEEIRSVQMSMVHANIPMWNHAQFMISLLNPLLYMELRGLKYNSEEAKKLHSELKVQWHIKQRQLNLIAGKHLHLNATKFDLLAFIKESVVNPKTSIIKKRGANYIINIQQLPNHAKKDHVEGCTRLAELDRLGLLEGQVQSWPPEVCGEVESILGVGLNVESSPQMIHWLYVTKGYERQYNEDEDGAKHLTADVKALLTLYQKTQDATMKLILEIRSLLYKLQILTAKCDPDGRMRCEYGGLTETARLACYESPTGSGYNLQTVTKKLRRLFVADDGHYLWQCDLAGADGWTVAAHCHNLGDPTMWDDYMFGLKPAKVIARIFMAVDETLKRCENVTPTVRLQAQNEIAHEFNTMTRDTLKGYCKEVDQDGWLYFGCKRVQHGTNYLMGEGTMSDQIMKDSFKIMGEPMFVPVPTCGVIKTLYLKRYFGVPRWQNQVATTVKATKKLISASGRVRTFMGRIYERNKAINYDTWKQACSNEPQDNTSYATNCALFKLWHDPANRFSHRPSKLINEPLHQVHDALLGQFPIDMTEFCVKQLPVYFDNPLTIGGKEVRIPFEGAYGRSWGELTAGTI